ncbi:Zn-dependent hydrolase [Gammaproteobacteria bacterium]|nr:Zn-dependent hydrolase [Gammaproteobacteria bacterium]
MSELKMQGSESGSSKNTSIAINSERLWTSLMDMATIGATHEGGVCRVALTDIDKQGRDLFIRWCRDAGCSISIDAVGNIFARREGLSANAPAVLMGSHLDSQPSGGRFDGVYGVLAALEVIRTMNDHGIETECAIEACSWTNEEGARFPPAMMGSGVFAGVFPLDAILAKQDNDGIAFSDALESIGYNGDTAAGRRTIGTYLEAHIEQGPILESEGKTIGVLTGGQAMRWYDVEVTGQEAHAGSTPMSRRADALVTVAKLVQSVDELYRDFGEDARSTCGYISATPNSRNTIVGHISLSVDLRHPDDDTLSEMHTAFLEICRKLDLIEATQIKAEQIWLCPATRFDANCIQAVRDAAEQNNFAHRDMVSGAGHDAFYLAQVAPTGMIFIPCSDGISHNPIESATQEDCAAGCQVLLDVALQRARKAAS